MGHVWSWQAPISHRWQACAILLQLSTDVAVNETLICHVGILIGRRETANLDKGTIKTGAKLKEFRTILQGADIVIRAAGFKESVKHDQSEAVLVVPMVVKLTSLVEKRGSKEFDILSRESKDSEFVFNFVFDTTKRLKDTD